MKAIFVLALALLQICSPAYASDLTAKPLTIFSQRFPMISHLFERAKIETRWNGFFLRADTLHFFTVSDSTPSAYGLWLGVRTLPLEDLQSAATPSPTKEYIEKTTALKFPKQKDGNDSGLLITLRYGAKCEKKAISEIIDAINTIQNEAQQSDAANP
jgi:hypothetical protein